MIRARKNDSWSAVLCRGPVYIVNAHNVRRQDLVKWLLGRHSAEMKDAITALNELIDKSGISTTPIIISSKSEAEANC